MNTQPTGQAEAQPDSGPAWAALGIDVVVADRGAVALMTVRLDPPGLPPSPDATAAAPARARAALAAAGVVHGIDEGAVAAALASPGERPTTVATATDAVPPRDAAIEAPAVARAAHDDLFTVPADTLVARRSPPRPGSPGTDVTGAPIAPAEPRVPDLNAGAGTEATECEDGAVEVRATIDGRPVLRGGTVTVEESVRCQGLSGSREPRVVHGNLVVTGDVDEGARVVSSGLVVVGGIVAGAHIEAERGVAVTGSCVGVEITAGAGGAARQRMLQALDRAIEALDLLGGAARQLVDGTAAAARPVTGAAAVRVLIERRHPDLPALWTAAVSAARADAVTAGAGADAARDIGVVSRMLDEAVAGVGVGLGALADARAPVDTLRAMLRARSAAPADVRAGYLQASAVRASGSLVITGAGTYNTDAVIGGDLTAEAHGATVRGGRLEVAGTVRVTELGAPGGARVEVVLAGDREAGEYLRAGVAHPGVEIVAGGRRITIEHRTLNLSVAGDDNSHVTRTGEISEDERAPLHDAG